MDTLSKTFENFEKLPVINTAFKTANVYKTVVIESMITAIVVLVALSYNEVIQEIIKIYFPTQKNNNPLKAKIIYALFVTLVVVLLQIYVFPYFSVKEGLTLALTADAGQNAQDSQSSQSSQSI